MEEKIIKVDRIDLNGLQLLLNPERENVQVCHTLSYVYIFFPEVISELLKILRDKIKNII